MAQRSLYTGRQCWLKQSTCRPRVQTRHRAGSRRPPPIRALFGGKNDEREREKERMFQAQQEILKERRSGKGKAIEEAKRRRQRIQEQVEAKKNKKAEQRRMLSRGEKLPEDKEERYKDDPKGGIIIPIVPFGIPKYDQGERFDLKLPYVDKGWVDEDADPLKWVKGLFGGKKAEDEEDEGKGKRGRK